MGKDDKGPSSSLGAAPKPTDDEIWIQKMSQEFGVPPEVIEAHCADYLARQHSATENVPESSAPRTEEPGGPSSSSIAPGVARTAPTHLSSNQTAPFASDWQSFFYADPSWNLTLNSQHQRPAAPQLLLANIPRGYYPNLHESAASTSGPGPQAEIPVYDISDDLDDDAPAPAFRVQAPPRRGCQLQFEDISDESGDDQSASCSSSSVLQALRRAPSSAQTQDLDVHDLLHQESSFNARPPPAQAAQAQAPGPEDQAQISAPTDTPDPQYLPRQAPCTQCGHAPHIDAPILAQAGVSFQVPTHRNPCSNSNDSAAALASRAPPLARAFSAPTIAPPSLHRPRAHHSSVVAQAQAHSQLQAPPPQAPAPNFPDPLDLTAAFMAAIRNVDEKKMDAMLAIPDFQEELQKIQSTRNPSTVSLEASQAPTPAVMEPDEPIAPNLDDDLSVYQQQSDPTASSFSGASGASGALQEPEKPKRGRKRKQKWVFEETEKMGIKLRETVERRKGYD